MHSIMFPQVYNTFKELLKQGLPAEYSPSITGKKKGK